MNRDRWLIAVLPALLVLVGYVFIFEMPQSTAIRRLNAKVAAAKPQAVSTEHIRAQRAELDQLDAKVESLRAAASHATRRTGENRVAPRKWNNPAERPAAMAALSRLLETRHMVVVAATRLADAEGQVAEALNLKKWLLLTGVTDKAPQPELWKVELVGDYNQMLEVLRDLPQLDRVIVPLQLSMDMVDPDTPRRRWSLVLII